MKSCNNDSVRGSKNNNRRYPGVSGRRPDRYKTRQAEALARQAAYDLLPIEEKKARNPKRYQEVV